MSHQGGSAGKVTSYRAYTILNFSSYQPPCSAIIMIKLILSKFLVVLQVLESTLNFKSYILHSRIVIRGPLNSQCFLIYQRILDVI